MPYLTPDEIPEDDVCRPLFIPDDTAWLAIVSGALTELTQAYNWQQEGAVTVEEAVERMQALIDQYYADACGDCELPDGEKIIGQDIDGRWQELVNGEWVDPTGDYEIPPVPAREDPTAEERRCLAAANATNVLAQLYETALDDYESLVDPIIALTGFASETVSSVGLAIGLLTKAFLGIVTGIWAFFYAAMEFLTTDVWDAEFSEKLQCILYECSADDAGVVTFDYNCVLEKLRFDVDISEPDFSSLRIYGQVAYILYFIGQQGLDLAGATTAIEEAGCEDCVNCFYALGGNGLNGWVTNDYTSVACGGAATYDAGDDKWTGGTCASVYRVTGGGIELTFIPSRLSVRTTRAGGTANIVRVQKNGANILSLSSGASGGVVTFYDLDAEGWTIGDTLSVTFEVSGGTGFPGAISIDALELCSTGL